MDGEAWWVTVHATSESWTWLSNFTGSLHFTNTSYSLSLLLTSQLPSASSFQIGHLVSYQGVRNWQTCTNSRFFLYLFISSFLQKVVVLSLSYVQLLATPGSAAYQASLSFTISQSLLNLMSIESVMPSNHLILCCPLLFQASICPSIRVFSNELTLCLRWPKYWSFSISPSNEYSELISFRISWFDLLAVQGTLKSLLQHHN